MALVRANNLQQGEFLGAIIADRMARSPIFRFDTASFCAALSVAGLHRPPMADKSISGRALAAKIGRSQNCVATRLRDEQPFTVDDVEATAAALAR